MTNALRTAAKSRTGRLAGFLFALGVSVLAGSMLGTGSSGNGCPPAMTYGQHFVCYAGHEPPKVINFEGVAGERVLFRMRDTNPNPAQGQLAVKNPSGSYLCVSSTTTEVEMECTLTEGGIHQMLVVPPANTHIFYSVYLARISDPPTETVQNIAYGQILPGNVAPMRWHPWQFEGQAGDKIVVSARHTGGDVEPRMKLRRPNGSTQCSSPTISSSEFVQECTLSSGGTHTIWIYSAQGSQSGPFEMYLTRLSPSPTETSTAISYGQIVSGDVTSMRWHRYTFQGAQNERILTRLRETGGEYYALWSVRRPDGSELCSEGTQVTQEDWVECTLNVPGTNSYTIWVWSGDAGETGSYDLYLARMSEPTTEMSTSITYGDVVTGSVLPMRWYPYTFNATNEERVLIRVRETGGDYHAVWTVRRPDGSELCTDSTAIFGEEFVECLPNVSGTQKYTIWMRAGDGNESGDFQMYLARMSEPTTEPQTLLTSGQPVFGYVEPMRWQPFRIATTGPQAISVNVAAASDPLNPRMSLRRSDNSEVCAASDSTHFTEICTLNAGGTYTLWVWSGGGGDEGIFYISFVGTSSTVPPVWWQFYAGGYSYESEGCLVQKDPITMVFRTAGQDIVEHLEHHGSPDEDDPVAPALRIGGGSHQYFWDLASCSEGTVAQANKGGNSGFPNFDPNERWHIRCHINATVNDPAGGQFAACTPHWDHVADCDGEQAHIVQSIFGDTWPGIDPLWEKSGFDAGRDYLHYLLVQVGGHEFLGSQNWENDDVMRQCDDETWSGSDGYVNEIGE